VEASLYDARVTRLRLMQRRSRPLGTGFRHVFRTTDTGDWTPIVAGTEGCAAMRMYQTEDAVVDRSLLS